MNPLTVSGIAFAFVFGGTLLGMGLRALLPEHHLSPESKDAAKLATGLIATMAALVLGLLVASAKETHDSQSSELTQLSANVVVLDRVLAHYGPETDDLRAELRGIVARLIDALWSPDGAGPVAAPTGRLGGDEFYDRLQQLSPANDEQRSMRSQALQLALGIGQTRWLMFEQKVGSVSLPLLVVLVLWLTVLFVTFGLFAPRNGTVVVILCASALSVSGAIFLILEMYSPYDGLIQISSAPLRAALAQLGH